MNEQQPQDIKKFLQNKELQERIQKNMQEARSKATVTISRAASLFGFSESQLREWEKKGLLTTERASLSQDSKGHRQYSPNELDKLAIIKELIDAKFGPSDIPPNVDEIWEQIAHPQQIQALQSNNEHSRLESSSSTKHLAIDKRAEHTEKEVFWRYFTSQVLRLSLKLICEDIPDTVAGLVLPLHKNAADDIVCDPHNLPDIGEVLIGWLGLKGSFYTLLDSAPSFEVPSDFRIQPLAVTGEDMPHHNTLIVVERKSKPLNLSAPVVKTIQCLLEPIYSNIERWRPAFDYRMRGWLYQATDFTSSADLSDEILNDLANMVVHFGNVDGRMRWQFCYLLLPSILPNSPILPMQQRRLVVRAQSDKSPHIIGSTTISPDKSVINISHRAFFSGQIIYRSSISIEDLTIAPREVEEEIGSAIAIPIAGEDGIAMAVMYVASNKDEVDAFSEDDQRVLRMIGRMIGELLMTYQIRKQTTAKLKSVIETPTVVDEVLGTFFSENMFIKHVESLLIDIQNKMPEKDTVAGEKEMSFVSIDIDNQSSLASMYGDRAARNLSRALGEKISSQLRLLFTKRTEWRFYYIYGGRFYILLDGTSLELARTKAKKLQEALNDEYKVDALRVNLDQPTSPNDMLKLPRLTVRIGVASYKYWKLAELLRRYARATPITSVISLIIWCLDIALYSGKQGEIIAWDRKKWALTSWSSPE